MACRPTRTAGRRSAPRNVRRAPCPLTTHRLHLERRRGECLEAAARAARYACLRAADVDVVALAHHADDQAETLLLQLLRGAGPHGLAAMARVSRPVAPPCCGRCSASRARGLPRTPSARALAWIDDESNADRRHARNFLRHEVAPRLVARFPGYPATLARAARHQAEAAALADELAALDAADADAGNGLERERLGALSPARARNLLRWFLRARGLRPPSEARLAEMLRQLEHAAPDARTRIAHDGAEIGFHRGRIVVHAPRGATFVRAWHGESELWLPGGKLVFESARGAGLAAAKLARRP